MANKVLTRSGEKIADNGAGLLAVSFGGLFLSAFAGAFISLSSSIVIKGIYILVVIGLVIMLLVGALPMIFASDRYEDIESNDVDLAYTELNKNYSVLRKQAQIGFLISVISMFLGTLIIFYGVYKSYIHDTNIDLVSISSGLIIEFIAGSSFLVYKINFNRLNDISDKLFKMWKVKLAIEKLESSELKNEPDVMIKLLDSLIES